MKADPVETTLARARAATEAMEPPAGFSARVLARAAGPRSGRRWWAQLGPVGRRAVPVAALAAAAALTLAWFSDERLDEADASAFDLAQDLP